MRKIMHILLDADSLTSKISCVLCYILLYDYIYEEYIYELFEYMGNIDYIHMSVINRISWIILSIIPFTLYHRINEISTFLCLFIYILVYIPLIHAFFITEGLSTIETYCYSFALCGFLTIYFQIHRIPLLKGMQLSPICPLYVVEIITLALTIAFLISRANSMHFVNIFTQADLLYSLRAENAEKVEERSLILYVQGWLSGAFYPFLLVWYLKYKSYIKASLILLGFFLLFMVDMQKSTFFIPFIIVVFFYFIRWKEQTICNRLHSFVFWGIIVFSSLLMVVSDSDNKVLFAIVAIVLLRTVCVTGWLAQMYLHFFQENPYTYYTHINVVNAITNAYPYDVPLGMAVAYNSQNANATFFLTEGIASWGIIGVIITGFIFLALLYFINSITYRYQKSDIFVIFIPTLICMLNASIFSTLLTGGLFILIFLFACCDPMAEKEDNNSIKENASKTIINTTN